MSKTVEKEIRVRIPAEWTERLNAVSLGLLLLVNLPPAERPDVARIKREKLVRVRIVGETFVEAFESLGGDKRGGATRVVCQALAVTRP